MGKKLERLKTQAMYATKRTTQEVEKQRSRFIGTLSGMILIALVVVLGSFMAGMYLRQPLIWLIIPVFFYWASRVFGDEKR